METGSAPEKRIKVAIIGSGNIGSDLMYKLLKQPGHMELVLLAGIVPASDGLTRARSLGITASAEGIKAVLENPEIKIVFDATSAKAHVRHAKALREAGRIAIDLTPAARGPYVIPPANLGALLDQENVTMVTGALLEVGGAGNSLPKYAATLDLMTAAARRVGEVVAQRLLAREQEAVA